MSRIGRKPVHIPKGVTLDLDPSHLLRVTGSRGTLEQKMGHEIQYAIEGDQVVLTRPTEQKRHKALHGLYRALLQQMIVGVTQGYKKTLEIIGVAYKVTLEKGALELELGYAHKVYFFLPPELTAYISLLSFFVCHEPL